MKLVINLNVKTNQSELVVFYLSLAFINTMIIIWSIWDHALPVYDMAWNLFCGLNCRDLLAHVHLRNPDWWQTLLSGNPLYPPFVYFVYGLLNLILGTHRWVDVFIHSIFSSLLFISVYGLGNLITKNKSVAVLSSLIIFFYPQVFLYSHYDMLDMPGIAMVSLALFCLYWWQQKPSYCSSTIFGLVLMLATLTKNNSIAFILPPVLLLLGCLLLKKDWLKLRYFSWCLLFASILMLPWFIFGLQPMLKAIQNIQQQSYGSQSTPMFGFIDNFLFYCSHLPLLFSAFMFILLLLSISLVPKELHKKMIYLIISSIGGIIFLGSFHWVPIVRYMLPVTIPAALYMGWAIVHCWQKPEFHVPILVLVGLTLVIFAEANFSPFPLPQLPIPANLKTYLGILPAKKGEPYPLGCCSYPMMQIDWGHEWVLNQIKPRSDMRQQTLAIMSNTAEASAATYTYLAKYYGLPLSVFTPRTVTMLCEDIHFRPDIARTVDWYLLQTKSASEPSHLSTIDAEESYQRWCSFVRTSKLFQSVGYKPLPNGSQLELYRNLYN